MPLISNNTWVIRKSADIYADLGEHAMGEQLPLLWLGSIWSRWKIFLPILPPLILILAFTSSSRLDIRMFGSQMQTVLVLFVVVCALIVIAVTLEALRAGFIPGLYWVSWSPSGLECRFLGRTLRAAPGTQVDVKELRPFVMLVRTGDSPWIPVSKKMLRKLATPASSIA